MLLQPPPGSLPAPFSPHHISQERPREDLKKKEKENPAGERLYNRSQRDDGISQPARRASSQEGQSWKPRPPGQGRQGRAGSTHQLPRLPPLCSRPWARQTEALAQPPEPTPRHEGCAARALLLPGRQGLQEQGVHLPCQGPSTTKRGLQEWQRGENPDTDLLCGDHRLESSLPLVSKGG